MTPQRPAPEPEPGISREVLAEMERLAKSRPGCHKTVNDFTALLLLRKLHAAGTKVDLTEAHGCTDRIRIAAQTGVFPDYLL